MIFDFILLGNDHDDDEDGSEERRISRDLKSGI
jgi:hypothetical protein